MKIEYKSIYVSILTVSLFFVTMNGQDAGAHNFDTDDHSTFLTLINLILVENRLINNSLTSNDNNQSLTFDYVKNIDDIVEDIIISENSFIVDSDQFYNNTVIATAMANLADEVLRNYGSAFGIPSNVMLSMDFTKIANLTDGNTNNTIFANPHFNQPDGNLSNISDNSVIDRADYYNAQEISNRMVEIYNRDLDDLISDKTYSSLSRINLENALNELSKEVSHLGSPLKIMEIVHAKIHPNLQLTFNLTLKR
ncbi:hypothetical protein [Candidatus Nitrosocosmicus arcticus]|uniref:Uncharacterized protein n=1 Tax=Candidatus Nitrosocosmicus arcticus TaxID=2035267 RepID=A0A557SYA7_9ARCH|nr:hypothetical protein [Candidatus Nitrosocosmicus arcticus]TVP41581.1 exported protein of unknown function [Candidatus Nitrosocosmicus arcticus]